MIDKEPKRYRSWNFQKSNLLKNSTWRSRLHYRRVSCDAKSHHLHQKANSNGQQASIQETYDQSQKPWCMQRRCSTFLIFAWWHKPVTWHDKLALSINLHSTSIYIYAHRFNIHKNQHQWHLQSAIKQLLTESNSMRPSNIFVLVTQYKKNFYEN